jgi:hypothetical protein
MPRCLHYSWLDSTCVSHELKCRKIFIISQIHLFELWTRSRLDVHLHGNRLSSWPFELFIQLFDCLTQLCFVQTNWNESSRSARTIEKEENRICRTVSSHFQMKSQTNYLYLAVSFILIGVITTYNEVAFAPFKHGHFTNFNVVALTPDNSRAHLEPFSFNGPLSIGHTNGAHAFFRLLITTLAMMKSRYLDCICHTSLPKEQSHLLLSNRNKDGLYYKMYTW